MSQPTAHVLDPRHAVIVTVWPTAHAYRLARAWIEQWWKTSTTPRSPSASKAPSPRARPLFRRRTAETNCWYARVPYRRDRLAGPPARAGRRPPDAGRAADRVRRGRAQTGGALWFAPGCASNGESRRTGTAACTSQTIRRRRSTVAARPAAARGPAPHARACLERRRWWQKRTRTRLLEELAGAFCGSVGRRRLAGRSFVVALLSPLVLDQHRASPIHQRQIDNFFASVLQPLANHCASARLCKAVQGARGIQQAETCLRTKRPVQCTHTIAQPWCSAIALCAALQRSPTSTHARRP